MTESLERIVGPRVPRDQRLRTRYWIPSVLLFAAGALLVVSFALPYWHMKLEAPQYPKGLRVKAYLNRLEGDVREIDGLNHYIGMRPLNDAAQLEKQTSVMMVGVVAGLLIAAIFIHSRWAALAAFPALVFPLGFLADLQYWLASFGTNLDPKAALSSSVKPFVPPVLGVGVIGQFRTIAIVGDGLRLAIVAAVFVLIALYFHRRAYKPLFDARRAARKAARLPPGTALAVVILCWSSAARAADATSADLNARIAAAQPGQELRVPAGTFAGPVTIDKPLALLATGHVVIDGGGRGDAVRITAPDVTLRGFRIRGTGDSLDQQNAGIVVSAPRAVIEQNTLDDVLVGILLNNAPDSVVRGNVVHGKPLELPRRGDGIRLWYSQNVQVEQNEVLGVRDVVVWYSKGVRLRGNIVRDSRYGLHFMYAGDAVIEENRLQDNSVGVFLMYSADTVLRRNLLDHNRGPSGYGLGLKDMDGLVAEDNVISSNRAGLFIDNSPSRVDRMHHFRRNTFAYNDVALAVLPAVQRNEFSDNTFLENVEQIAVLGAGQLKNNRFTVAGRGNYWSDYAGFDADQDGVGDLHYRAGTLFENLMDREPKLRLFLYSPAQQALELASRAFPIMQPEPKIIDEAPLMRPGPIALASAAAGGGWAMSAVAVALLSAAGLIMKNLGRVAHTSGRRREARLDPTYVRDPTYALDPTYAYATSASAVAHVAHPTHASAVAHVAPAARADEPERDPRPLITVRNLRKTFGRQTAVDDVSFDAPPGAALALWGTNGAGKTTIIKCLLGLHRFAGTVRIGGADVRRHGKAARRQVGYVAQELALYDDLTAAAAVRLFAQLKRVPAARCGAVLARVGLGAHAGKRVGALSGGMKQRLALALALLAEPPILLLDEPTSNLDAAARTDFVGLLRELKDAGQTLLFTTHRAEEVTALGDRVILLEGGRITREIAADELGAELGRRTTLRIPLPADRRAAALDTLVRAGFRAASNHAALLVEVVPGRKAAPLNALHAAGFAVADFELKSEADDE